MQEWMEANAPPLILAIMGGIADFLMSDEHSWANILVSIFLAGFSGYLVLLLCIDYGVSEGRIGIACGISGMSSRAVLALFKRSVIDRIRKYLDDNDPNSGSDDDGDKRNITHNRRKEDVEKTETKTKTKTETKTEKKIKKKTETYTEEEKK